MNISSNGDRPAIEITEAMVRGGAYAAKEHCLGESLESLAVTIFAAMLAEAAAPETAITGEMILAALLAGDPRAHTCEHSPDRTVIDGAFDLNIAAKTLSEMLQNLHQGAAQ